MRDTDASLADELLWEIREAGDDHPYGAWGGGSKSSGGRMGGGGGMKLKEKPFGTRQSGERLRDDNLQTDDLKDIGGFGQNEGLARAVDRVEFSAGMTVWRPNEARDKLFVKNELELHFGPPVAGGSLLSRKPDSITVVRGGSMVVYHGKSGLPVGYVRIDSTRGPLEGKIREVSIFKSERGKGYGTKMYDQIQDNSPINLYDHLGVGGDLTPAGKTFASKWLRHRQVLERSVPAVPGQGTLFGEAAKRRHFTATEALAVVLKARVSSKGMRSPEEP